MNDIGILGKYCVGCPLVALGVLLMGGCSGSEQDEGSGSQDASHDIADGSSVKDAPPERDDGEGGGAAAADAPSLDAAPDGVVKADAEEDTGSAPPYGERADATDGAGGGDGAGDGDSDDATDAGAEGASACAPQTTPTVAAGAARSAGFNGTDTDYYALYDAICQKKDDCTAPCISAGGAADSCTTGSDCIEQGQSGMYHCLPPTYWRSTDQALSQSGTTSAAAELTLVDIDYLDALVLTDFAVTIPDDAFIQGIQFEVHRNADDGLAVDQTVQVLRDGSPVGLNHAQAGAWPKTLAFASYGGPSDTWGSTWRPADVRSPGFGLAIAPRYTSTAGNDRAHIDSVQVSVFYTMPCD